MQSEGTIASATVPFFSEWRPRMSDTALIDKVRATRHRIAEECGHDPMKIIEHAEKAARELGRRESAA